MELKAHFSGIHQVIMDHLRRAQSEIVAAVAWFTDEDIFDVLCKKAGSGVKVSIALIGDEINLGPGGLNFSRIERAGGSILFLPAAGPGVSTMHHKFCVIDYSTVITGSYNWSRKARNNDENITIVTDSEDFASKYLDAFDSLLAKAGQTTRAKSAVDLEAVRRRLGVIRSLVLLGEGNEVAPHVRKLRPAIELPGLAQLVAALDGGEFKTALEMIDDYLHRAAALVVADEADVHRLRFELLVLEVRLESLSDEKAELERRLIAFNHRHDVEIGDLIKRVLRVRAEFARLAVGQKEETREQADAAARNAEEEYADYSRRHEQLQSEVPLPKLDENAERELKRLYRKSCSLCHPDKFPEEQKVAAHRTFTELQDAYKRNDLNKLRELHESLVAGGLPSARSNTLRVVDELRAAIAEMERSIASTLNELKALHGSDACELLEAAGSSEEDWKAFFTRQREVLGEELARLENRIFSIRAGDASKCTGVEE